MPMDLDGGVDESGAFGLQMMSPSGHWGGDVAMMDDGMEGSLGHIGGLNCSNQALTA